MAKLGHDIVGIDVDAWKVDELQAGRIPFFEPGLPQPIEEVLATGRLEFSPNTADAKGSQVHFVCVGTPQRKGGYAANMRHVVSAFASLLDSLKPGNVVVGKSTVPVSSAARLADALVLLTKWDEYRALTPEYLGGLVQTKNIFDERNIFDSGLWRAAEWAYKGIGRP
ncbi:UDP-glucose 6-dehydrogenase [Arthrobacter sp. PL16]|uniref:hypothetical protein n=1 Tax=Arthrobacter sp. PL16 TaxID=3071720 RepID=UPI002DF7B6EB|nr:UDP-glucose 6-dehydrogenase [Arthrobacter sp. PL16]